jgi:uncharacterized protein (TIGR03118 family)
MSSAVVASLRNRALLTASFLVALTFAAEAEPYIQTNLVSNIPGLAAVTDPLLVNPWGFSHSGTSPVWISNQGSLTATLYNVTGTTTVAKNAITVGIPTTPAPGPEGPTGQVFAGGAAAGTFAVNNGGNGSRANFIFADLNGTISAWNTGAAAFIQATVPGAVFTGLTMNQASTQLFAANGAAGIQVFDNSFAAISLGPTAFTTPLSIASLGLVAFNVKDINGKVYVTYAPTGLTNQRQATTGQGAIAVFDESGNLLGTLIGSQLASPWGLALSSGNFGFGNALLVGNFSFLESEINAFDPTTFAFLGTIPIDTGSHAPGGLWEIGFGSGGNNGNPNTLYFTDGIDGETNGLFAAITFVPEPFTMSVFGAGLVGTALLRRRRRNKVTPD